MADTNSAQKNIPKFAGMEVPPDLTKGSFFFLFFNTLLIGMLMSVPAILQPAFLSDIVKIDQAFSGSINSFLQNMSQIATLALVAFVGVLSDKVGRKILAVLGFIVLTVFFYLFKSSNEIAAAIGIGPEFASNLCALLSFVPGKSAEFVDFAPGLLTAYGIRLIIGIGLVLVYPQFITMVADYTHEKDRGKGMAANGLMMGVAGILVFAVLAPVLKNSGVGSLFYIAAVIASVGAVCTGIFLKDRMVQQKSEKKGIGDIIGVVNKSLALKASYLCSLITRADVVVLATFLVTWGVKYGKQMEMASKDATMKASIPMIIMSVFSFIAFPVLGVLLDKWGRVQTILLSLLCGTIGMFLLAVSPNPFSPLIYIGVIFASFGMSGAIAGANTLATDASPKALLGSILGGLNTMQPIGILFFLLVGGKLFDSFGAGWAFGLKGAATLVLAVWMFIVKDGIQARPEEG